MRITVLLEVADQLWGGVKVALEDANWLSRRGHQVTVVSRSGPPAWMDLDCAFQRVTDFRPENLPDGDVLIGTFWSTVPWVASAGPQKGVPVHLCQGFEGDNPENEAIRDRIEATYRLPGLHHITISPHLTRLLRDRFGIEANEVRYVIDHDVHHPGAARTPRSPLRVGLVGPYGIPWKDLRTGYAACRLAHQAGQNLVLVRATNTAPCAEERDQPFPIEWHEQLRPDQMGDFYRSLDVFLGTSRGHEEGFFLPAIEAMACGVPSVLTSIPCFRNHAQLVGHDRYALFVEPQDPAAMAEALVLAGALPDVRGALRQGGLEVADQYRPQLHGEQLEAVLQRLCGDPLIQRPNDLRLVATQAAQRPATQAAQGAREDATLPELCAQLRRTGDALVHDGRFDDAARVLEAAHCLEPDDRALLRRAADAHLRANHPNRALRMFDELAALGADDEALHMARGHALHALVRMHEAAQAFRAALATGARTAEAYNRLGVVLYQSGDHVGARDCFERALALDPEHGDARDNLAALPAA